MTTELEKRFFSTFGIKKRLISPCKHLVQNMYCDEDDICRDTYFNPFPNCVGYADCREDYKRKDERYPQITDRHYLELICIDFAENPYKARCYVKNIEELKNYILEQFIHEFENDLYWNKESVKHQVQQLFKE